MCELSPLAHLSFDEVWMLDLMSHLHYSTLRWQEQEAKPYSLTSRCLDHVWLVWVYTVCWSKQLGRQTLQITIGSPP